VDLTNAYVLFDGEVTKKQETVQPMTSKNRLRLPYYMKNYNTHLVIFSEVYILPFFRVSHTVHRGKVDNLNGFYEKIFKCLYKTGTFFGVCHVFVYFRARILEHFEMEFSSNCE
jgi:hypothetical protein